MKEIKVPGVSEPVLVSKDGTSIIFKGKELHQTLIKVKGRKQGYYQVYFQNKKIYVHQLVALAYVTNPKPVSYKNVLHLNGKSEDNNYTNLIWGNRGMLYKIAVTNNSTNRDENSFRGRSRISYEEAIKIAKRLDEGEFAKDICKEYDVSEMSIARIRKKYCKKKIASPRYPQEVKDTVMKLLEKYTPKEVSAVVGIPYESVLKWKKQADVSE